MFKLQKALAGPKHFIKLCLKGYGSYFLGALLYICFCQCKAQETTPLALREEIAIFSAVNETGGYLTQERHQAFWELMKKKYSDTELEKIISNTPPSLEILKAFQAQTWKSAKESYFAKKEIKNEEYLDLQEKLLKQGSPFFSSQIIIDHAQQIVTGAATRCAVDLGLGKFYVTPELIEENGVGIQGSFERLKLLFTPFWQGEYKEYLLPNMNVSLLSLYPPDEYHELIQQGDEQIDIQISQLCVDKNATFEIGAIDYQKGDKKFVNFSPEEREIYIQEFIKEQFSGYRVSEPMVSKGTWRGHEFSRAAARGENDNMVMMGLFIGAKAFYIKYITNANLALANNDFNEFTKRIQLFETSCSPS